MEFKHRIAEDAQCRTLRLRGDIVGLDGKGRDALDPFFATAFLAKDSYVRIPYGRHAELAAALERIDPALLIVDAAHFDSLEDMVDSLLEVRKRSLKPAIVLCSHAFGHDDLSLERAAICDVSVRLPISSDKRAAALVLQAFLNNRALARRKAEAGCHTSA